MLAIWIPILERETREPKLRWEYVEGRGWYVNGRLTQECHPYAAPERFGKGRARRPHPRDAADIGTRDFTLAVWMALRDDEYRAYKRRLPDCKEVEND